MSTNASTGEVLPSSQSSSYETDKERGSSTSSGNEKTAGALKTGKDGTILQPQPSDDPADPLNWSWGKKHLVLVSLFIGALLTDGGMTWGATLIEAQAAEWHMTPPAVEQSLSGGIFMQGAGGLLVVPLIQRYGRLPVFFWSQLLSFVMVIAAAYASTYGGFTACRTLQGLFNTPPQILGLSMIHDMFFFHEYARKIGVWSFGFLLGPYLEPFISGLILEKITWRHDFVVLAAFYAFSLIVVIFCADETLYDRSKSGARPNQPSGIVGRIQTLVGITGFKATGRPSPAKVAGHLATISIRPQILVMSLGFYMIFFMWAIGLNNTLSQLVKPPPYLFSNTAVALLFLAPMIGGLLGELWGKFFNDWLLGIHTSSARRSSLPGLNKSFKPEVRLWAVWPAVALAVIALVVIGQCLEKGLSWVGLAFGWGIYGFATLAGTVAITAYGLDCFPQQAAQAASVINFWRTTGGFCVVYFQVKWISHSGAAVTFGAQAGIVAASSLAVLATMYWGPYWRAKFPPPKAEN